MARSPLSCLEYPVQIIAVPLHPIPDPPFFFLSSCWIQDYSIKSDGCVSVPEFEGEEGLRSSLLSQRWRIYVVDMKEFVEFFQDAQQEANEYNCEVTEGNCEYRCENGSYRVTTKTTRAMTQTTSRTTIITKMSTITASTRVWLMLEWASATMTTKIMGSSHDVSCFPCRNPKMILPVRFSPTVPGRLPMIQVFAFHKRAIHRQLECFWESFPWIVKGTLNAEKWYEILICRITNCRITSMRLRIWHRAFSTAFARSMICRQERLKLQNVAN